MSGDGAKGWLHWTKVLGRAVQEGSREVEWPWRMEWARQWGGLGWLGWSQEPVQHAGMPAAATHTPPGPASQSACGSERPHVVAVPLHTQVILPKFDIIKYDQVDNLQQAGTFGWGGTQVRAWVRVQDQRSRVKGLGERRCKAGCVQGSEHLPASPPPALQVSMRKGCTPLCMPPSLRTRLCPHPHLPACLHHR